MGFENCKVGFETKNELGNGIGTLPIRILKLIVRFIEEASTDFVERYWKEIDKTLHHL